MNAGGFLFLTRSVVAGSEPVVRRHKSSGCTFCWCWDIRLVSQHRFVGRLDNTVKREEIELAIAGTSHKVEITRNQRKRIRELSGFSVRRNGIKFPVPAVTASYPYSGSVLTRTPFLLVNGPVSRAVELGCPYQNEHFREP